MDLKTLNEDLEAILNRPNELISKSEAEGLKSLGKQAFRQNNFRSALEFNIRAAKIYEALFKKTNYDKYLTEVATCYDHAGRSAAYVAARAYDGYYRMKFTEYAIKFKEFAGDLFAKRSVLEKEDERYRKRLFLFAAVCYERASKAASLYFRDLENAVRLRKQAYIFYKKAEKYEEAIWKLSRTVRDLCCLDNVPKDKIRKLDNKVKKLIEKHGLPKGFKLEEYRKGVQEALLG